jgi:hypothetical protein
MISQATTQRLTTTLAIKKKCGYLSLKHKKKLCNKKKRLSWDLNAIEEL